MAAPGLTADSSIVVPSLLRWHPLHEQAASLLADVRQLPAHALAESFSVLTRLPAPRALRPAMAYQLLARAFPDQPLMLGADGYRDTIRRLAEADAGGGRTYDAIVAATAAAAGRCLLTADRRAMATYAIVGATYQLIE
jgi:predicted nucleic acid-binding protein